MEGLAKKAYTGVRKEWEPNTPYHSRGVFKGSKPLPRNHEKTHAIIVDPGVINDTTWVRETIDIRQPRDELAKIYRTPLVGANSGYHLTSRCKEEAEVNAARRFECKRKELNPDWAHAVTFLSEKSLMYADQCMDFATRAMQTYHARKEELISRQRVLWRFTLFRAKQRALYRVASTVAYDLEKKQARKDRARGEQKRANLRQAKQEPRVVVWGDGWFTSPAPTKATVRVLGGITRVLIMDEKYTSKKCHICLQPLVKKKGSRMLRCVNPNCGRGEVNRDENGGANIGTCVVHKWIDEPRPPELDSGPYNQ